MKNDDALKDFLIKQKSLLKIEKIATNAGAGQRLRRYLANRDLYFIYTKEVNVQLVNLYESLGKYLTENKIVEPKGLFK